jgi:hypothetical protein
MSDIDVDVKDRSEALSGVSFIPASIIVEGKLKKHPTGIYFQKIPQDPVTGLAVYPSGKEAEDIAEEFGFTKLDVIPNHAYEYVRDRDHLRELIERPVDWSLFTREDVVSQLHQLGNHFDIVDAYEPKSVEDLACLIAIIRPGKRYLLGEPWEVVRERIWVREGDGYLYKKSHAIAFAVSIIAQLQSLIEVGLIKV